MIECAIIRDLLPLYADDVLSKESKALVGEHLAACEECRREFSKMQNSEIKVDFHDKDSAKISILKSMKRKLFKKNVMVSLGSIAVLVVFALALFNWVLLPQTSIPYEDGLLKVEMNTMKVAKDENGYFTVITDPNSTSADYEVRGVLDMVSSRKTADRSATYFNVEENGEKIRLVFVNFTESLLSKWEPGGETAHAVRIADPYDTILSDDGENVVWEVFDRVEVYYINQKISELNPTNDYAKFRNEGILIWSGALD
jgi:hypothetical protein